MSYRVMAHMIPYYPNATLSYEVARALVAGGATYLEVQFPFSDPTADGPAIQAACNEALSAGFSVEEGFAFLETLQGEAPQVPVFLMTYASIAVTRGLEDFLTQAKSVGVRGLIIPDLPPDYDESLYDTAAKVGIGVVPVVVTSASPRRLDMITELRTEYVYVALRRGTTGEKTRIEPETLGFLDRLSKHGAKLLAGFGISEPEQVRAIAPHVDAAVVGSAFVRAIAANDPSEVGSSVRALAAKLTGRS